MRRLAEWGAWPFIMRNELINRYKAALESQFPAINLAAKYYQSFARLKPKASYRMQQKFNKLVADVERDPLTVTKNIDEDVKNYWEAVRVGVLDRHAYLVAEFRRCFGEGNKEKHRLYLDGRASLVDMEVIEGNLEIAYNHLPRYEFSDPEDVRHWTDIASSCCSVVNDAYETHENIVVPIKGKKRRRREIIDARYGTLGRVASIAVSAGKGFLVGIA